MAGKKKQYPEAITVLVQCRIDNARREVGDRILVDKGADAIEGATAERMVNIGRAEWSTKGKGSKKGGPLTTASGPAGK